MPTARPTGIVRSAPPSVLVGTTSPGDLYRFERQDGSADRFTIVNDRGTPADPSDDVHAAGELNGGFGSPFPLTLSIGQSDDGTTVPLGAHPVVELPGFGFAIGLPSGVVTAVEPGGCPSGSVEEMTAFQVGFGARIEANWAALSTIAPVGDGLDMNSLTAGGMNGPVSMRGRSCATDGRTSFATVSTPSTRAVEGGTAGYPYEGPLPSRTVGQHTRAGAFVLDFGRDHGSVIGVPARSRLADDAAARAAFADRLEGRVLEGMVTQVVVLQPTGADREDPSIARTLESTSYRASIQLADAQSGTLRLATLSNTTVVDDVGVVVTLNAAGRIELMADLATGSSVKAEGIVVQSGADASFVLAAPYADGTSPIAAIAPTVPAGQEIRRLSYAIHLRLRPPRGCLDPGLVLPSDYSDGLGTSVGSVLGLPGASIRVSLDPGARRATAQLADGSSVDFSGQPNFMLMHTGTPVQLSTAPGRVVRILCGPEYPWAPPPTGDLYAEVIGADTGAAGSVGFALPGTYVVESGLPGAIGGGDSTYYVFEVSRAP